MTQSTRTSAQTSSSTSAAELRAKTDPSKQQDADFEDDLPGLESATGQALQKLSTDQQQHQMSTAAWAAIVTVVVKSTPESELEVRRVLAELQEVLARAAEEKRKKSKDAENNQGGILSGAATLFGEKTATALQSTIDRIVVEQGNLSSKDPAALAKLAEQLAALLAKSDGLVKHPVSAQALQQQLQISLTADRRPVNEQDFQRVVAASVAQKSVTPVVIGKDLAATTRANPEGVAAYLVGKDGPALLQNRLTALKTVEERVQLLTALKQALGAEKFSEVLQSYDKRVGAPLVYDLVRAGQAAPAEQRALVAACFGSSATLFTKAERERFITFAKTEQALTLEAVKRENSRVVASIGNLEREQVKSVRYLADAFKVQNLTSVAPEQLRAEIVTHPSQQFPGLKGKSWDDTQVALKDLLATKDPEAFQKKLTELGVKPVTPPNSPEAELQREQLKEFLVVVTDHMTKISENDGQLAKLRTIAAQGQLGEEQKLIASFDAVTKDLFPEYTPERFATARTEARIYIENLEARIARSEGTVLAALCAERDGIEWRALQTRIQLHVKDSEPQLQRAVELINQFQLACGTGPRGRGSAYARAAETLGTSFGAIGEYVGAAAHSAVGALEKCHAEQSKLQERNERLKAEAAALEAKRDNDFSFVSRWFSTDAYTKAVAEAARARSDQQLCEAELNAAEKRGDAIKSLIEKTTAEAQKSLLISLVTDGTLTDPNVTPQGLVAALSTIGAVASDVDALNASFKALNAKRLEVLSTLGDLRLAAKSNFLTGSMERGMAKPLSTELQALTGAKTGVELVGRIHSAITTDVTVQPSSQALDALRSVVGRDSELGRQLAALAKSPSNQILLERLFARLSVEEVMRIKLFLLSYDRPDIMRLVPTGDGSKRPILANAQELWAHLNTLKADGARPELGIALSIVPGLRSQREVEALLSKIPAERVPEVLAEYERLAGGSLGQTLLALAPSAGPIRAHYILSVLCVSPLVSARDLAPFFPNGQVPASIEARAEAMQALLVRDLRALPEVAPEVTQVIKDQAAERATLLAALPVMTQLTRTDRVSEIQKRLAVLDESFDRVVHQSLQRQSADTVARLGERARIEALQQSVTESAQAQVADPYGKLSRDASRLVEIFETPIRDDEKDPLAAKQKRATAVLDRIREGNYSENEALLLEVFYAQHVSQRAGGTELSGNIRKDLEVFGASGAFNSRQISTLLQGGAALHEYDVELLTQGLRTRDGQMTVRAMIALEAKHALKETFQLIVAREPEMKHAWQEVKESKAGRVAGEYYHAVTTNDTVKASVIAIGTGIESGVHTGGEMLAATGRFVAATADSGISGGRELYKGLFGRDIAEHAEAVYHGAGSLVSGALSSDPVKAGASWVKGGLDRIQFGEINLPSLRKGLDSVSNPEERRRLLDELEGWAKGFPNSFTYVDGKGPAILQYIRATGGPLASADAAIVEQLLKAPQDRQLTEQQFNEYSAKREQLQFQLAQVEKLRGNRDSLVKGSEGILTNIDQIHLASVKDKDTRLTWGPTIDQARKVVDVHGKMVASQSELVRQHQRGLADIDASAEILRVRAVVLLKSTLQGVDLGLDVEQGNREVGALRTREAAREQVIVRRNDLREWEQSAEIEQKALAQRDKWVSIGYTAVKTAVIIAATIVTANPGIGFAVATAWNVLEKAYKVGMCNMSVGEAFREGLIDLAIDSVFLGFSSVRLARVVVKGSEGLNAVTKLKIVFVNPFKRMAFENGARSAVVFREEVSLPGGSSLERAVTNVAGKYFKQAGVLKESPLFLAPPANAAKVSVRGLFTAGDAMRLGTVAASGTPKPTPAVLTPTLEKPHGDIGGASWGRPRAEIDPLDLHAGARSKHSAGVLPHAAASAAHVAPIIDVPAEVIPVPSGQASAASPAGDSTGVPNTPQLDLDRILSMSLFNINAAIAYLFGWLGGGEASSSNPPVVPPAPPQNPPVEPPSPDRPPVGPGSKPGLTNGPVLEEVSPNGNAYTRASENVAAVQATVVNHSQAMAEPEQRKVEHAQGLQYYRQQAVMQKAAVPQGVELADEHAIALAARDRLAERNRNAQAEMNSQAAKHGNAYGDLHSQPQSQANASQLGNTNSYATAQSVGQASIDQNLQAQHAQSTATTSQSAHTVVEAEIIPPTKQSFSKTLADIKAGKIEVVEAKFNLVDAKRAASSAAVSESDGASKQNKSNAEVAAEQSTKTQSEQAAAAKRKVEEVQRAVNQAADIEATRSVALKGEAIAKAEAVAIQSRNQLAAGADAAQTALAEAQEKTALAASAVYAAQGAMTAQPPRMKSEVVINEAPILTSGDESGESSSEDDAASSEGSGRATPKKRIRVTREQAARERAVIIQQLLTRSFEQSKREKLLRMLIALGMSEKEYRELVIRVGQAETERMASANQTREAIAIEPLEVLPKSDVPTMKNSMPRRDPSVAGKGAVRTRADLLAKLRKQA
jgi:hypothetical protein